jgi:hypothetical protein
MSLQFIRRALYSLTRRYGAPGDIYRTTTSTTNNETGVITSERIVVRVRRMIRLPDTRSRQFAYDIAFLAANKNFTYGGTSDQGQRDFIVLGTDIGTFKPTMGDWIVHDSKRWNVEKVEELDYHQGFLLKTKQIDSDPLCQIFEHSVSHTLEVSQETSYAF